MELFRVQVNGNGLTTKNALFCLYYYLAGRIQIKIKSSLRVD